MVLIHFEPQKEDNLSTKDTTAEFILSSTSPLLGFHCSSTIYKHCFRCSNIIIFELWITCLVPSQAANYLDIKALLDILCQTVADVIKGKDPEAIRRTFHASDPHTEMPPLSQETHSHTPLPSQDPEDVEHSNSSSRHKETPV